MTRCTLAKLIIGAISLTPVVGCEPDFGFPDLGEGDILVTLKATGEHIDYYHPYKFHIDGSYRHTILALQTVAVLDHRGGQRTITLISVAANCEVTGENPLDFFLEDGETEHITFDVTCSEPVVTSSDQTEIPAIEHQALVALYESANGAGWTNKAGWLETNTPCSWYGVHCESGAVFGLNFDGNRLAGSIPSELGNLGNLAYLVLQGNWLSGTIPAELGNLDGLSILELNDNRLSGPIPPELGELVNLVALNLHNNQLSGPIPVELGNLTNLRDLYLHENELVGTIPEELGNLIDLREMFLRHNQLTGLMPIEVAVVGGSMSPDHHCQLVPGNAGLFMPDTPEYRAADVDGDGYICRLGFTP